MRCRGAVAARGGGGLCLLSPLARGAVLWGAVVPARGSEAEGGARAGHGVVLRGRGDVLGAMGRGIGLGLQGGELGGRVLGRIEGSRGRGGGDWIEQLGDRCALVGVVVEAVHGWRCPECAVRRQEDGGCDGAEEDADVADEGCECCSWRVHTHNECLSQVR